LEVFFGLSHGWVGWVGLVGWVGWLVGLVGWVGVGWLGWLVGLGWFLVRQQRCLARNERRRKSDTSIIGTLTSNNQVASLRIFFAGQPLISGFRTKFARKNEKNEKNEKNKTK